MTIPAQQSAQVLSGHKGVGGLDSAIQPLPTAPTANASVGPETQVLSLDMPTQPLLVLVDKPGKSAYRQTKNLPKFCFAHRSVLTQTKMHTDSDTIFSCNFYNLSYSLISTTMSLNKKTKDGQKNRNKMFRKLCPFLFSATVDSGKIWIWYEILTLF